MRYAFHLIIKTGMEDEYDKRHVKLWQDMRVMLKNAGVLNYSIFRDGQHVFGYWESYDVEKTLAIIKKSEANAKWQLYMSDVVSPLSETRKSRAIREVFHLE